MKKILYLSIFLLATVFYAEAQSKNENELAAAIEKFDKALIDADKITLENLTEEELNYGHSDGKVQNKTQFIEQIVSGSIDFLTIDISGQTIEFAGNNAIVRHVFTAKFVDEGKSDKIKIGVIMVWQKQKRKWRLFVRQGYNL